MNKDDKNANNSYRCQLITAQVSTQLRVKKIYQKTVNMTVVCLVTMTPSLKTFDNLEAC